MTYIQFCKVQTYASIIKHSPYTHCHVKTFESKFVARCSGKTYLLSSVEGCKMCVEELLLLSYLTARVHPKL